MELEDKNYYEVLMVHPKAERIVIEAAFRRLARAYHPDVCDSLDAHSKMVLFNEAWEVLGNEDSRREYDVLLSKNKSSSSRGKGGTKSTSDRATAQPESFIVPTPPNPLDFGVPPDYYQTVVIGAQAWKARKRPLSPTAKIATGVLLGGGSIALSVFSSTLGPPQFDSFLAYSWVIGIALSYFLIVSLEERHDARLLREKFNPKYNPNQSGYYEYAQALAQYESEVVEVFVTRTGACYHRTSYCGGTLGTTTMPRFQAEGSGYSRCSRCGYFSIQPRQLPPPFGKGILAD